MRRAAAVLSLAILAVCFAWPTSPPAHAKTPTQRHGFVRVYGTQFTLLDKPFRFVGANASVMHGRLERKHYDDVLAAMAKDGLQVVRIWALGETHAPGQPHHPMYAFRIGREGWVEESFTHLDKVLVSAKKHGLKVIVVLANRWKDYGGVGMYMSWAGVKVPRDVHGEPFGTMLAGFYDCGNCQDMYRAHVSKVVGRVNTVSGVAYRDDPTIMAWELINEASAVTARDEETLVAWVRDTARFVRTLDGNHMISAGHIGYSSRRERNVWRRVTALPEVAFADTHSYPLVDSRVTNTARLAHWVDDPIDLAHLELRKPLVFGEFGFARNEGFGDGGVRARWMQAFLGQAAARGAAGALVWIYEPRQNETRRHTISDNPKDKASVSARKVLRDAVAAFKARPPALGKARPRSFPFVTTVRGSVLPHRGFAQRGDKLVLDIDPTAFARAQFEKAGVYRKGAFDVVYGLGEGFVEYRFVGPVEPPKTLAIDARVSSELPGYGSGDDPRDGSDIEFSLNGEVLGTVWAKPDDGLGDLVHIEVRDADLLERLFRKGRRHVLKLRALPSRYAGGLCVYGKITGAMEIEPGWRRPIDSIRLTLAK
jgi:mannan endo-1,4-beta-mannosidase